MIWTRRRQWCRLASRAEVDRPPPRASATPPVRWSSAWSRHSDWPSCGGGPGTELVHSLRADAHILDRKHPPALSRLVRGSPARRHLVAGGKPQTALRTAAHGCRTSPQWARRALSAADPSDRQGQPQGPQQALMAAKGDGGRGGRRVVEGGLGRDPPHWVRIRFKRSSGRPRSGLEVAMDLALPWRPPPSVGDEHRSEFTTPGTHHRVRETAKTVPGHLPVNFERPEGIRAEVCASSCKGVAA